MARRGLAGSGTVFDGEGTNTDELETLGEEYYLTESYYKPYPGCRWSHSGIDAAFELLDAHDIALDDIEEVRVHSHRKAIELGTRRPENPDEAEYSYPYMLAAAIVKRDWLIPADLGEATRTSPRVRDMMDKISLHHDPEAQELYSGRSTSRVEIVTGDGTYESDLTSARGARERPLSEAEHHAKQAALVDEYCGDGTAERLRAVVADDDAPIDDLLEPLSG